MLTGATAGLMSLFKLTPQDVAATRALKEEIPDVYLPPLHRRPRAKQIGNMMKTQRQKERLDRNPLLAVHLMYKQNRDRMFGYGVQSDLGYLDVLLMTTCPGTHLTTGISPTPCRRLQSA